MLHRVASRLCVADKRNALAKNVEAFGISHALPKQHPPTYSQRIGMKLLNTLHVAIDAIEIRGIAPAQTAQPIPPALQSPFHLQEIPPELPEANPVILVPHRVGLGHSVNAHPER